MASAGTSCGHDDVWIARIGSVKDFLAGFDVAYREG